MPVSLVQTLEAAGLPVPRALRQERLPEPSVQVPEVRDVGERTETPSVPQENRGSSAGTWIALGILGLGLLVLYSVTKDEKKKSLVDEAKLSDEEKRQIEGELASHGISGPIEDGG